MVQALILTQRTRRNSQRNAKRISSASLAIDFATFAFKLATRRGLMEKNANSGTNQADLWPALPLAEWQDTYATLHMWTQVVGKIRLRLAPPVNHWWHSTLYVTPRGLTTSAMPYGGRLFEMEFDFVDHTLNICRDDLLRTIALGPRSVADFYSEVMATLKE